MEPPITGPAKRRRAEMPETITDPQAIKQLLNDNQEPGTAVNVGHRPFHDVYTYRIKNEAVHNVIWPKEYTVGDANSAGDGYRLVEYWLRIGD
jgi:hypothetical protein